MPIQKKTPFKEEPVEEKYIQGTLFEEEETEEKNSEVITPGLRSGMDALEQALKERGEATGAGKFFRFSDDEQIVMFIDEALHTYFQHWTDYEDDEGKTRRRPLVCAQGSGQPCPLCDVAVERKFNADFPVLLLKSEGDNWVEHPQVLNVGPRAAETLAKLNRDDRKGPLKGNWYAVYKTGDKLQTLHHFDRIKLRDMEEDYGIPESAAKELANEWVGNVEFYQVPSIDLKALRDAAKKIKAAL